MADQQKLEGWGQIEDHLGMTRQTILKHGYPVKRLGGVFAYANELDAHRAGLERGAATLAPGPVKTSMVCA